MHVTKKTCNCTSIRTKMCVCACMRAHTYIRTHVHALKRTRKLQLTYHHQTSQMTVIRSTTLVGLCSEQHLLELGSCRLVKLKVNIRSTRRINHLCRPTAILHTNHQPAVDDTQRRKTGIVIAAEVSTPTIEG